MKYLSLLVPDRMLMYMCVYMYICYNYSHSRIIFPHVYLISKRQRGELVNGMESWMRLRLREDTELPRNFEARITVIGDNLVSQLS